MHQRLESSAVMFHDSVQHPCQKWVSVGEKYLILHCCGRSKATADHTIPCDRYDYGVWSRCGFLAGAAPTMLYSGIFSAIRLPNDPKEALCVYRSYMGNCNFCGGQIKCGVFCQCAQNKRRLCLPSRWYLPILFGEHCAFAITCACRRWSSKWPLVELLSLLAVVVT